MTSRQRSGRRPGASSAVGRLDRAPPAPKHLNDAARAVWAQVADYLVDRGTLHSADVHVVEAFAQAVARAQALQEMLDAEGLVKDGRAHPAARLLEGAVGTIRNTSMLLGLAPLARQKLTAEVRNREGHGHEEGEWQRLLKR